jgi:hypothetical protein
MLHWLYTYVASSCFQCFICFFRRTLQVCLSRCCICFTHMFANVFIWMWCMFLQCFKCFSDVFASISDTCFKYFICLQTYVASVAFECFKSRSMLHFPPRFLLSRLGVSSSWQGRLGICRLVTLEVARTHVGAQNIVKNYCIRGRLPGTSMPKLRHGRYCCLYSEIHLHIYSYYIHALMFL